METQMINIIGVLLGILAPAVLLFSFARGIKSTNWKDARKKAFWRKLLAGVVVWTILVFGFTIIGTFEYTAGDILPRFLIGLLIPVTIMMVVLFKPPFGDILDKIPLHILVGTQFFRLFGAVFFLIATSGMGPEAFISSGYGDVITGLLACLAAWMLYKNVSGATSMAWIFTVVGLFDLMNVSRILLENYPIWSEAEPSSALAGSFPLMLVIGITAPVALVLHVYTIRALLVKRILKSFAM